VEKTSRGGDASVELLVLVQEARVRHDGFPLLERGGDDLRQTNKGASAGWHLDVEGVPGHERYHRDEHGDGGQAEPPLPPDVVLDVHHDGHGRKLRELDPEEVEVEEAPLGPCAVAPARVQLELVGAERHDAGARAPGADGRAEQRRVEDRELEGRRALAVGGVLGAVRRVHRRERRREREADHADLVDNGAERDGPEAAGEGVGDEAADERGEVGGAVEVADGVGGLHERQVQLQSQVRDQVRAEPNCREPVAELVRCHRGQAQKEMLDDLKVDSTAIVIIIDRVCSRRDHQVLLQDPIPCQVNLDCNRHVQLPFLPRHLHFHLHRHGPLHEPSSILCHPNRVLLPMTKYIE
jgi:hypothetical protein